MQPYTVQSGDTLSAIAKRYGVGIGSISGYRSGNPNLIYPGEKLTVSGISTPVVPQVTSSPTRPTVPTISSSTSSPPVYQGGQSMPAYGTPEYVAQFKSPPIPSTNTPQPTTPAVTTTPTPTPSTSSTETSNETLDKYLKMFSQKLEPSQEVKDLQRKVAEAEANRVTLKRGIEQLPIARSYMGGYETELNKNIDAEVGEINPMIQKLESQRASEVSGLGTMLGVMKPTSVAPGNNLVDPITGRVISSGTSPADTQARDTFYNLAQTYPDAGIVYDPSKSLQENLTSAQQKVSNSPSFQAKNTVYAINPLTGEPTIINKRTGESGWESSGGTALGATAPSATGGGVSLDVGSSGNSVSALQNWLIQQGYNIPAGATGYYGAQTQAAVAAFQKATGIDTSGGGVGTFGPRTQAAAAQKGFSIGGEAPSPQAGGTPSPTMDVSRLAPELRATLQDLGGIKFFDASKATTAQLPYLQRASQATGIPLLSKEDANKVQETYGAFTGASSLVDSISSLTANVITATNDSVSQTKQAAYLTAVEKAPSLFTDDGAKQFISARNSVLSLITRAAGEKGVLTNQDVARIKEALPSYGDNAGLATQKANNLLNVLNSVFKGAVQAYITPGSSRSNSNAGNATSGVTSSGIKYTVTQ